MPRRLMVAVACLTVILLMAACRPYGAGTSSPATQPSAVASPAQSTAAPATPSDSPAETPIATTGSDYGY